MPIFDETQEFHDELHVFFLNKRKRIVHHKKTPKGYSLIYLTVVHPIILLILLQIYDTTFHCNKPQNCNIAVNKKTNNRMTISEPFSVFYSPILSFFYTSFTTL
jgi:hypothetical protein